MRIIVLVLLIVSSNAYPNWFHEYKNKHRKLYDKTEEKKAFDVLEPKYHFAKRHGYELTHRSDKNHSLGFNPFRNRQLSDDTYTPVGNHRLGMPLTMDWRTHGAVTSVKTQGSCGGCFAFAAVGSIEFWYWKYTRKAKDFSVQQWIDCTKGENYGCEGGLMHPVFKKAMRMPAGPASFDKYRNRETTCRRRLERPWLRVKSFAVQSDDTHYPIEQHLAHNLVQYGPIPIGIDSTNWHFEMYRGGILKESQCGKDIDHAVLLVGYTPSYWIIKNSWGPRWGQHGYLYLERGKNACGINSYASFITDAEV